MTTTPGEATSFDTDRTRAAFQMLDSSADVVRMMAGVKQQFITDGGYSPENAETCAVLLWQSGLAAQRQEAGGVLEAVATAQLGRVTAAAQQLLTTLTGDADCWLVGARVPFTAAVNNLMAAAGLTATRP